MAYNMTFMDVSNNTMQLLQGINNNLMDGLWSSVFLILVFVISFGVAKKYDTSVAMVTSSFLTSIFAILLYVTGLLILTTALIPIILFFATLFYHMANR